jgi:hypothetical protein
MRFTLGAWTIIFLAAAALATVAAVYTSVSVVVLSPVAWGNITYPDGLYEPDGLYPQPVTLNNFTIFFHNFTVDPNRTLACDIRLPNGSSLVLSKTFVLNVSNIEENLTYVVLTSDPSGAYERSWYFSNCTVTDINTSTVDIYNDTQYPVYVKTDPWYFSVGGVLKSNDAANAYISWKSAVRAFFGHNDATEKDVRFAVHKYSGVHRFEGNCNNSIDDNGNGLTDCADPDCQAVFFAICGHTPQAGGGGYFAPRQVALHHSLPNPSERCDGNICSTTIGGATVMWTQTVNPNGQFKVYVDKNVPNPEIVFITLKNSTSTAVQMARPIWRTVLFVHRQLQGQPKLNRNVLREHPHGNEHIALLCCSPHLSNEP